MGFRISSYHDEGTVLFYASPKALSGAPARPFTFESDIVVPDLYADLPEETDHVRFEDAEFFTAEDGAGALRFRFRALVPTGDDGAFFYCSIYQDGIELPRIWDDAGFEGETDEQLFVNACKVRTGSPVVIIIFEEGDEGSVPVAMKVVEAG